MTHAGSNLISTLGYAISDTNDVFSRRRVFRESMADEKSRIAHVALQHKMEINQQFNTQFAESFRGMGQSKSIC